jgi:hypothetical protein
VKLRDRVGDLTLLRGVPTITTRETLQRRLELKPCKIDEQRLERGDRARPHATAGRGVKRVFTKILGGGET